ncbi:8438_t:CDS:2 [Funneliformis geosporum]|uniref:8438_t:CDS:1 n=1 Tax=Funneliformis geosporum TaxID=1117311 RepID=A0A9W4SZJ1_9GLOM|nr:8438_t:CDS:2 [Funneliformis geosporum]
MWDILGHSVGQSQNFWDIENELDLLYSDEIKESDLYPDEMKELDLLYLDEMKESGYIYSNKI